MRRRPTNKNGFLSYEQAKEAIKALGIKNSIAYKAWAYSMKRPTNIPVAPRLVYEDRWLGWEDYLGLDPKTPKRKRRPTKDVVFMSFPQAKDYVSKFKLKTVNDFKIWASSDKRPQSFPSNPDLYFREEWKGYPDFLGIKKREFLSFEEAKKLVQELKLKNEGEYRKWAASSKRPEGMPSNPDKFYKEHWLGWRAFLGTHLENKPI